MISANKNITTGFVVATLVLFATVAVVSAAEGPAVMVTDYKVEPAVLMPGDTGIITVTIQNGHTIIGDRNNDDHYHELHILYYDDCNDKRRNRKHKAE